MKLLEYSQNIIIEPMKESDLPVVAEIEQLSFTSPWSRRMLEADLKKAHYFVAKDGDRVIGYIGLQTVLDEGHIPTFAVHPKFRGKGLGIKLVEKVIEVGREKKLNPLRVVWRGCIFSLSIQGFM